MSLARWIPNAMSLLRLALGLVFPAVPAGLRIPLILLAAATDYLDGFLARKLNANSDTGRWLDPTADKVFVLCLLITLIVEGALPPEWAAAILARDFMVAIAMAIAGVRRRPTELRAMRPRPLGKITTAAQFSLLFALVLDPREWIGLQVATAILSVLSAVDYLAAAIRHLRNN